MDRKTFFLAFFTMVIWGSGFAAIKASILGGYSSGHLVLVRFLIASLVFLIYAILTRATFKLPHKSDILRIVILGFVGITIYHTGVTFGQQTITAGTTAMIIGSAPIFTALIAIFILKEKMEWFGWVGLGVGFIGITLITIGSSPGDSFVLSKGILIVIVAAISASVFFVYQKPLFRRYHPIELTAYFTWAGTIPLFFFLPGLWDNIQGATIEANLSAIYVGVFPAAVCYAAWAIASSRGDMTKLSPMLFLEPVFAILIAWLWLNELPSNLSLLGGFIAVSSVAIVNIIGHKVRRNERKLQINIEEND